jgi:hypothetical protein
VVLLRPWLLADPVAGLYVEIHAPDWRFVLLSTGASDRCAMAHRKRTLLDGPQWRAVIGLTVCFYLWTLVSGNGRYYLWGLLLVGPLVIVAVRRLPATLAMRNTVILAALALQGWAAWMTYEPNVWALRPWAQGPGLELVLAQAGRAAGSVRHGGDHFALRAGAVDASAVALDQHSLASRTCGRACVSSASCRRC